jgi:hypothetical protein
VVQRAVVGELFDIGRVGGRHVVYREHLAGVAVLDPQRRTRCGPEGNEFCVLEPREIYRDTGPIAAVVVDCADPRAMARFWDEAMDWTLHEVTDDHAVLRSVKGVGHIWSSSARPA